MSTLVRFYHLTAAAKWQNLFFLFFHLYFICVCLGKPRLWSLVLLQGAEEALGVRAVLGHLDFVPMSEPMPRGVKLALGPSAAEGGRGREGGEMCTV